MKYLKKNVKTKLIVALLVLLLFNAVYPSLTYAVDFGGILMQPIYWLLLGSMLPTDMIFGAIIKLQNTNFADVTAKSDKILREKSFGEEVKSLFVGPDTIFKRGD